MITDYCNHKAGDKFYFPVMIPPENPDRVWYLPVPIQFKPPYVFMGKEYNLKPKDCFRKCIYCGEYVK